MLCLTSSTLFGLGFPPTCALHRAWPEHSWCLAYICSLPQYSALSQTGLGSCVWRPASLDVMDMDFSLPTRLPSPAEHCIKWLFGSLSAHIFLSKLLCSPFVGRTCHLEHPNLLLSVGVCFPLLPPPPCRGPEALPGFQVPIRPRREWTPGR